MLAPPGELAPPPRGNPGSATGNGPEIVRILRKSILLFTVHNASEQGDTNE